MCQKAAFSSMSSTMSWCPSRFLFISLIHEFYLFTYLLILILFTLRYVFISRLPWHPVTHDAPGAERGVGRGGGGASGWEAQQRWTSEQHPGGAEQKRRGKSQSESSTLIHQPITAQSVDFWRNFIPFHSVVKNHWLKIDQSY